MLTGPHVFLFDADADGVSCCYGDVFDPIFLTALSIADPKGVTCSRIKRGDATISKMAQRIAAVMCSPRSKGFTLQHDMNLYKTIIWDLIESLKKQWHTLDLDKAAMIFGNHNVHCIMLPTLPIEFRDQIDQLLRLTSAYIGTFEIDAGNPTQRGAFCDHLVYDAAVINGQIVRESSFEGEQYTPFNSAEKFVPNGAAWRDYGWLIAKGPPDLPKAKLSDRGNETAALLQRKRKTTVEERVFTELALGQWSDNKGQIYSFEEASRDNDILQAILPDGKFTNYLFDADHKGNSGKAKFFIEELGIIPDDWRFLAAQFYQGLLLSKPRDLTIQSWAGGYGANFSALTRVTGRNGEIRSVKTCWVMRPGMLPSLVTAFPESSAAEAVTPGIPPIVPPQLAGNNRWTALHDIATREGLSAAATVVPTPMKVEGYSLIPDGACGYATVTVKNGRTGFARWLLKNGHGHNGLRGGATIAYIHETQSHDRAKAYAETFARVLLWNGVLARAEAHYD